MALRAIQAIFGTPPGRSPQNLWDVIAVAQHHGLPDASSHWTFNPLAAAFFALDSRFPHSPRQVKKNRRTSSEPSYPAVIYARKLPLQVDTMEILSPLDVKGVLSYLPRHATRRIPVQSGMFTVHGEPNTDWDDDETVALLLDFNRHRWYEATRVLMRFGVNRYSLFPDLDGLSEYLSSIYTRGWSLQLSDFAAAEESEDET